VIAVIIDHLLSSAAAPATRGTGKRGVRLFRDDGSARRVDRSEAVDPAPVYVRGAVSSGAGSRVVGRTARAVAGAGLAWKLSNGFRVVAYTRWRKAPPSPRGAGLSATVTWRFRLSFVHPRTPRADKSG
jgi:hypothetical protein